jgi:hypothetical protein
MTASICRLRPGRANPAEDEWSNLTKDDLQRSDQAGPSAGAHYP